MNTTTNSKLKKIVLTALFAALSCVATMSIKLPTPGTGGYIHPGDAMVILSGVVLGPWWGLLAGGIGSAMADLLGGYFVYVPITFAIKGLVAVCAGLLYQKIGHTSKSRYAAVILGGIADIILGSRWLLLLRILFPVWFRCIRKRTCQPDPGTRRTHHFSSPLSDPYGCPGCKTDCQCGK